MMVEHSLVALKRAEENQHHLVLMGPGVSEAIRKSNGLDESLFNLHNLTYLYITKTCLQCVPKEIGKLTNLTILLLHSNEITKLPNTIGELKKLKVLDCSNNKLDYCPPALGCLPQLRTLNLASNLLSSIPSQRENVALNILNLGDNKFKIFPDVCYAELVCLSEIHVNANDIKEVPVTISKLPALKVLNLRFNLLMDLPGELGDCDKLEKLDIYLNTLYDKTLYHYYVARIKLNELLCYLRSIKGKPKDQLLLEKLKMDRKKDLSDFFAENPKYMRHRLAIKKAADDVPVIEVTEHVDSVRPFIAACIIRKVNFTKESFKKFIQLQTRLHEGICEKKCAVTIAIHDMKFMACGNLTYTAKPPEELEIEPLSRNKIYTGDVLFKQLQAEAETVRKITKQNVYPERYKYLNLLKGKSLFPCLLDHSQEVISFPPIVSSNKTKVSMFTKEMFVEVTSAISYRICRKVLEQFLKELTISGLTNQSMPDFSGRNWLTVEQVRVQDTKGNRLICPSKKDLEEDLDENSRITVRECFYVSYGW